MLVSQDGADRVEFGASLTVGRHPFNELVLGHPRISARHATLEWNPEGWVLRDLGSSNGTTVNGHRIVAQHSVVEGDRIRFGEVSTWLVARLTPPAAEPAALAVVEFTASSRCVSVFSDRFLIGTGPPCDLVVREWVTGCSPIRLVLFEESGGMWAEVAGGVDGVELDDAPWSGNEVALDRPRSVRLGPTRLTLRPAEDSASLASTERARSGSKSYALDLFLSFDGPAEGTIRVLHEGREWMVRTGQRFMLLFLLARARGDWVADDALKLDLWGRAGLRDMDPSALHKLIYDTRQLFIQRGVDGWFIEKNAGRTRLRLSPERLHLDLTDLQGP
jgi:hypothetical protein